MIGFFRNRFNSGFTLQRYHDYLAAVTQNYPGSVEFRLAETPLFIPRAFKHQMLETCEYIIDRLIDPDFKFLTENAIPDQDRIPGQETPCQMICFDFGICNGSDSTPQPMLIEMQGFASLFAFQVQMADSMLQNFPLSDECTPFLSDYNRESYLTELKSLLLGQHLPEEVILLEVNPEEQKTKLDFYLTRDYWGIQFVCISQLIAEEKKLYYLHPQTKKKTRIKRIYNRFIFDDLRKQEKHLPEHINIRQDWDVEWIPHPNWFYRISKYTLPLLNHPNIPQAWFLNQLESIPSDLENYVLKPLFSFAGQGVLIDVTWEDLKKIADPENWILQQKVEYAPCIQTPEVPAKAEIRLMYIWKPEWKRPKPIINLARLSKGKMIGVNYNKDLDWVGGSICLFEK